jgi:ElaB/YqjD/DUF883 family membrane-anchored ribosome-binding protein
MIASKVLNHPYVRTKASQYFNNPVESTLQNVGPKGAKVASMYQVGKSLKDYQDVYSQGKEVYNQGKDIYAQGDDYIKQNPRVYDRLSQNVDNISKYQSQNYGGKKNKSKKYSKKNKSMKKSRKNLKKKKTQRYSIS